MAKKKLLLLNSVYQTVNEKGNEKIKKLNRGDGLKTDDYGRTREWYEEAGLKAPNDLLEEDLEVSYDGFVQMEEDELDDVIEPLILDVNDFSMAIWSEEAEQTTVYLKNGITVSVLEDVFQIYGQIDTLQMGFFEKLYYRILNLIIKEDNEN